MESYNSLREKLNLVDLPYTKDWSAAADFLGIITDYCLATKPTTIVECSSGFSTVILARCCEINQCGHVVSLENGLEYANKTREQLQRFNLAGHAKVIDAPLANAQAGKKTYLWYQATYPLPDNIDLLIIDGPPGSVQKLSRYPALPILYNNFAEQCRVYLDDAAREDEVEIVQRWNTLYHPTQSTYRETERGCAILDFNK